jgi:hypothetical protein
MTSSTNVEALLSRGYFPRELPPPFNSLTYGRYVKSLRTTPLPFDTTTKAYAKSRPEIYNLARAGSFRRELAILNPIHFAALCECIARNWSAIAKLTESKISLTSPTPRPEGRAVARGTPLDDLPKLRAESRSQGRFLLKADVIRFYPSIYTHSIPWAVHGKAFAKANRGLTYWGNRLDFLMRNCQDAQTNGIPVGPDTSLVIAELILTRVDRQLARRRIKGLRYMDDYELVFDSEKQALEARTQLQQALLEYELNLSGDKTAVYPLPQKLEERWVSELNLFPLSERDQYFHTQLIRFFDRAFELAREFPQEGVLKYAAGRIAKLHISGSSIDLVEDLLMQSALVEAGALSLVLLSMLKHQPRNAERRKRRHRMLLQIISSHAPQRHSSEVAWAVWACIAMKLQLSRAATKSVLEMDDSVCALLALHARRVGLIENPSDLTPLRKNMTADDLYGPRWLLAYEANVKGWFQFRGANDYVAKDRNFRHLKSAGVRFYDTSKTLLPEEALPTQRRTRIIEDYLSRITSSYEEQSDDEDVFDDDLALELLPTETH